HGVDVGGRGGLYCRGARRDQIADGAVDHAAHGLAAEQERSQTAELPLGEPPVLRKERHGVELGERDEARAQAVVDVVVVVRNRVRDVRELRLEPGLAPLEETPPDLAELARAGSRA